MARGRQQVSKVVSGASPTKGINDTDPLANTEAGFCISMLNLFPNNASVDLRSGYQEFVVGIDYAISRLLVYAGMGGTYKLFAVTNAGIFDASTATDPDYPISPSNLHALTSGLVTATQLTNTGGTYLIAANGVDDACFYNGTSWAPFVADATPVNPGEIDGLAPDSITCPLLFKNRLWVVEKDSLSLWYFPTDAVAGVLQEFPMGGVFPRGGKIVEIVSWSLDTGAGMDDMFVVRSSMGEIAIYSGTDPTDALTWELVSVYYVSEPVGKVSSVDLGGDSIMLTRSGLIPLSKVVQGVATESLFESALSRNISKTLNRLIVSKAPSTTFEWEVHNIPALQMLMVLIPPTATTTSSQYVMNTTTGAWTSFDLPATCAAVSAGVLYFGTADGRVCKYTSWSAVTKDCVKLDGTGGGYVSGEFLSSFSYLGDPTTLKHFKLVRPVLQALTQPDVRMSIAVDFNTSDANTYGTPTGSVTQAYNWDEAIWDEATWATSNTIFRPWSSVTGMGYAAALRFKMSNISATSLAAVEVVYESGGVV